MKQNIKKWGGSRFLHGTVNTKDNIKNGCSHRDTHWSWTLHFKTWTAVSWQPCWFVKPEVSLNRWNRLVVNGCVLILHFSSVVHSKCSKFHPLNHTHTHSARFCLVVCLFFYTYALFNICTYTLIHWGQLGIQCLDQGYFDLQTGGVKDWATNLLVGSRHSLPQPQPYIELIYLKLKFFGTAIGVLSRFVPLFWLPLETLLLCKFTSVQFTAWTLKVITPCEHLSSLWWLFQKDVKFHWMKFLEIKIFL